MSSSCGVLPSARRSPLLADGVAAYVSPVANEIALAVLHGRPVTGELVGSRAHGPWFFAAGKVTGSLPDGATSQRARPSRFPSSRPSRPRDGHSMSAQTLVAGLHLRGRA
jgi:hypothetical protein